MRKKEQREREGGAPSFLFLPPRSSIFEFSTSSTPTPLYFRFKRISLIKICTRFLSRCALSLSLSLSLCIERTEQKEEDFKTYFKVNTDREQLGRVGTMTLFFFLLFPLFRRRRFVFPFPRLSTLLFIMIFLY